MCRTEVVQKILTHILCTVTLFKKIVLCNVTLKSIGEPDGLHVKIEYGAYALLAE